MDCGGSSCYDCLQIFNWKAGITEFVTPVGSIIASEDGTTLGVTGTVGANSMSFTITNATGTWVQGSTFTANPTNFPNIAATYNTGAQLYSSENTGSNVQIAMARYAPAPNFIRITFSGTLKAADASSISIQNGVFQYDFP
ncbi:MAG: hypothetical protein R2809_13830 [Flavobacteriales bacterium]